MLRYYYLNDDNTIVESKDRPAWQDWYENFERQIDRTGIGFNIVSTVYLGIIEANHSDPIDKPLVFQTLILFGDRQGEYFMTATREEAQNKHNEIVGQLSALGI